MQGSSERLPSKNRGCHPICTERCGSLVLRVSASLCAAFTVQYAWDAQESCDGLGLHAGDQDFTMPGTPHESWMVGYFKDGVKQPLQCAGRDGDNVNCTSSFTCSVEDLSARGVLSATSVCANSDIVVTQTASFAAKDLFVHTNVRVEALVPGLTNVRYMRNVDPDTVNGYTTVNKSWGRPKMATATPPLQQATPWIMAASLRSSRRTLTPLQSTAGSTIRMCTTAS